MSERPDPRDGLGRRSPSTPVFFEPSPPPPPRSAAPAVPSPTYPAPARPGRYSGPARPSRWPAVLTTAVVLCVIGVTAVATLVARYADTHVAAPPTRSRPAAPVPGSATEPNRIDFTSARGTGRLVLRERSWLTGSPDRLRISVELVCTTGTVDHAPDSFQLFAADGTPVQPSPIVGGPAELGFGTLGPGEQVRGDVEFEVSRQVVTLVFNDDNGSVTALRIAD